MTQLTLLFVLVRFEVAELENWLLLLLLELSLAAKWLM